jgi:hypothetical protein
LPEKIKKKKKKMRDKTEANKKEWLEKGKKTSR